MTSMNGRGLGLVAAAALTAAVTAGTAHAVDLTVYEWEGYVSPFAEEFRAYAATKGVDVRLVFPVGKDGKPEFITSADDIFQKVRSNGADVVTPTHNYYKDSGSKLLKILAPIDLTQVPNYNGVIDNLRLADYATEDGRRFAVPLLGGGYSLAYNADRVKDAPTSWTALMDPRFKGRTTVTGAQYEANVYVAAILSGIAPSKVYQWESIDAETVGGILARIAANTRVLWDTNPDVDLMDKDLDLITDYGFGVAMANAKGQNWRFARTVEPTTVWLDNLSLTPTALETPDKARAAHLLLDFMLSPPIQARLAEMYGVVVPVPAAVDALPPEKRAGVRVGTNDFYRPDLLWQPLDRRTRNGFKLMWDKATGH